MVKNMLYEKEDPSSNAILFDHTLVGTIFQIDSVKVDKGDYYLNVGNKPYNENEQSTVAVFNLTRSRRDEINYDSYVIKTTIKSKMVFA